MFNARHQSIHLGSTMKFKRDELKEFHAQYITVILSEAREKELKVAKSSVRLKQISQEKPWRPEGTIMTY